MNNQHIPNNLNDLPPHKARKYRKLIEQIKKYYGVNSFIVNATGFTLPLLLSIFFVTILTILAYPQFAKNLFLVLPLIIAFCVPTLGITSYILNVRSIYTENYRFLITFMLCTSASTMLLKTISQFSANLLAWQLFILKISYSSTVVSLATVASIFLLSILFVFIRNYRAYE